MPMYSPATPLGSPAPEFDLPDVVSGKLLSYKDLHSKTATVVMFICNHCPYVIHVEKTLVTLAEEYSKKGVSFIAISANDVTSHPEDSPENMKERATKNEYPFPYLYDESQATARAYGAVCTPDIFVYDSSDKLAYRGRLDSSSPGNGQESTGIELIAALDALLSGSKPSGTQHPAMGCSIKWKNNIDLNPFS